MFPIAPSNMLAHKNTTVKSFGYDSETETEYCFNSLGYRADFEFELNKKPIYILGNSMSFGLGVDFENTYGALVSKTLGIPVYNFSWGCYSHTNIEQIMFLEKLLEIDKPDFIIFQINNLNRSRNHLGDINFANEEPLILSLYEKFIRQSQHILKNQKHMFVYWDDEKHDVVLPKNCIIKNRYCVDSVLKSRYILGPKSHKLISLKIIEHLKNHE